MPRQLNNLVIFNVNSVKITIFLYSTPINRKLYFLIDVKLMLLESFDDNENAENDF